MKTVRDLVDWGEERIRKSKDVDLWQVSDARVNAEELLSQVLDTDVDRDDYDDEVSAAKARRYAAMVDRRVSGEPLALILKEIEFRGLTLKLRKGIFIPRHSSEFLAEKAIRRIRGRRPAVAVDVATGTGPVAMAVANEVKHAQVYGLDIWAPSLNLARENARRLKIRNVKFLRSDMLARLPSSLKGRVDAFTMHPPYVGRRHVRSLPKEVKEFEPHVALTDKSSDGLELVRRLVEIAPEWLRVGGWVMFEVSSDLSRSVRSILIRGGFRSVKSERDPLGATRVVSGRL